MALIEFRSKAAAGFYMMPASFSQVCKVWGRGYSEQGSIPPEDLPDLITRLEAAVKLEKGLSSNCVATLTPVLKKKSV